MRVSKWRQICILAELSLNTVKSSLVNTNNRWYLEYFDDDFLIVRDVYGFKHFAVFSPAELSHQLVVILISVHTNINTTLKSPNLEKLN